MDFKAFKSTLPNCVYALHDYAVVSPSKHGAQGTNGGG